MKAERLKIGLVRRGFSASGGAEAYLRRLGQGIAERDHEARLFTTAEWPPNEWLFGPITRLPGKTPAQFADAVEAERLARNCQVVMSLERVWQCDIFRAGDGVHRAWLHRRARFESTLGRIKAVFNQKHRGILRLEESLFGHGGARRVIVNSQMVKDEIVRFYNYPAQEIHLLRNGVPCALFAAGAEKREEMRRSLGLEPEEIVVLFVGSGWSRKGLRFALRTIEACGIPELRLLVAGRGNRSKYRSRRAKFLGVMHDLPALYAAADIFLLPTIYDPFSNACLEALAAGLPVITTSANGFAEIIEDGKHGSVIAEPDDFVAMREALHFWADAKRRVEMRPIIQARAREFDLARNVDETLALLFQAAASASSTVG